MACRGNCPPQVQVGFEVAKSMWDVVTAASATDDVVEVNYCRVGSQKREESVLPDESGETSQDSRNVSRVAFLWVNVRE